MKKIALISQCRFLPVPAIYGGACEELMDIILKENEKNQRLNLFYIQKQFDKKTMKILNKKNFNNNEIIYIKNNRIFDFFIRGINKILRKLKINFQFTTTYDRNLFKFCKKQNFDKLIFEGGAPTNINKYKKVYSKQQIYLHYHSQEQHKNLYANSIGNIIGVSEFITNDWKKWLKEKNINDVNGIVLKNCVNEDKFNKEITEEEIFEIRNRFGFSSSDFVVMFIGRLVEVKGIKQLIEAIIDLPENIKLLIVGSPNFKDKNKSAFLNDLSKLTKKYSEKIKFTGFVENTEIYKYYKSSELHCVPSIWDDPAPLVIFEGIISGTAQLVTNSGGIPEYVCEGGSIIVDKENDLVNNLKKSIEYLSKNKELLKKMEKSNIEYSKKYKKINFYDDFVNIVEN